MRDKISLETSELDACSTTGDVSSSYSQSCLYGGNYSKDIGPISKNRITGIEKDVGNIGNL